MPLNFPANPAAQTPANTYSPTSTPDASTNGVTYFWDGVKWDTTGVAEYVLKSGDTMTGDLTVPNITVPGTITSVQAPVVLCNFGITPANVITINSSLNVASVQYAGNLGQYRITYSTPLTNTGVVSLTATVGVLNGGASYCNMLSAGLTQTVLGTLSVQPNGSLAAEASSYYSVVVWDVLS